MIHAYQRMKILGVSLGLLLCSCVPEPLAVEEEDEVQWSKVKSIESIHGCDSVLQHVETFIHEYPWSLYYDNAQILYANCLALVSRPEESVAIYRSVSTQSPEFLNAQFALSEVMLNDSRVYPPDSAIHQLMNLQKQFPHSVLQGEIYYSLGKSYYKRATSGTRIRAIDYDSALVWYQAVRDSLPLHKRAPDALYRIGWCHYQKEDYNSAAISFNEYVQQYPQDVGIDGVLYWYGKSLQNSGQNCLAYDVWQDILLHYPASDKISSVQLEVITNDCAP